MNKDDATAHPQGDFFDAQADRLHADLQNFSRQVASCDKLIRMANISLNQIDARIAEAAKVEARAAAIVDASAQEATRAATAAATAAVAAMVGKLSAVTSEAEQICREIDRSRGKTGLWNAAYIACTLAACLLTGYVTYRIGKSAAITPEIERAQEVAQQHDTLLRKASDREKKQINDILERRPKAK
ncbi:MAG: hypothetical protein ABW202_22175 [Duganella sp.]